MTYLAHTRSDGAVQTVAEHCLGTAELAKEMSVEWLKPINYLIGQIHDSGKYQPTFQKRIRGAAIRIEHALCGAKYWQEQHPKPSPLDLLVELCVLGHHTGIPDCGTRGDASDDPTLFGRLKRRCEDYSAFLEEMELENPDAQNFSTALFQDCRTSEEVVEKFAFLVRYCFSCLTDADSVDTARFTCFQERKPLKADFSACLAKLDQTLEAFEATTELQKTRSTLQKQVLEYVSTDAEVYLMHLPTGSGKTLCSMKFALMRALRTGKRRIIYVIPYNSIIEQTVQVFEEMFGEHAQILRHQSTFSFEDQIDKSEEEKLFAKLAVENWDAQIIITTSVQFFESVYANKRGKLRKLHNMADSVLVFDEAHLMPVHYMQPCLRAITYITRNLNSEALFLTATMPDFETLVRRYALHNSKICTLAVDPALFAPFHKCNYSYVGVWSDEMLMEQARQHRSALIVVNKRSTAKKLFAQCSGQAFHLSTYMTPLDRAQSIAKIRSALKHLEEEYPENAVVPPDRRVMVVSTSLIEAGVDLDFYAVYRELAGLDSILQTGGRCNREGKRAQATAFVFERTQTNTFFDDKTEIARGIMREFPDVAGSDAIRTYYDRLYNAEQKTITKNSISQYADTIFQIPFDTYARSMRLIDSETIGIAIPRDEQSRALIERLRTTGHTDVRQLQKYCASVYRGEFEALLQQHAIDDFDTGLYCLVNEMYYKVQTGICLEGQDVFI